MSNAPVPNPQNHVVEFRCHVANQITDRIAWVEGQPGEKRVRLHLHQRLHPADAKDDAGDADVPDFFWRLIGVKRRQRRIIGV